MTRCCGRLISRRIQKQVILTAKMMETTGADGSLPELDVKAEKVSKTKQSLQNGWILLVVLISSNMAITREKEQKVEPKTKLRFN